jgi:glycosyltransferase involved in cell wall biosynthesis
VTTKTLKGKIKSIIKRILYDEDYHDKVKRIIHENGGNKIVFVGNRRDVPHIMAALDVIVFPSTVPHAALPIAEAGAMARPVIASRWGKSDEPDESVVDGVTGILVPPGDSEALAKAIVKILTSPELARKMGEEGYKRAKKLFDAHENVAKVMNIYNEILGI